MSSPRDMFTPSLGIYARPHEGPEAQDPQKSFFIEQVTITETGWSAKNMKPA